MSAFWKELGRTIARKPGRFLALLAIVALGAGFYAGLRMTAPDMDIALDHYLDGTNSYDIRVVSTLGLTDDDLEALERVEGVERVMASFECDAEATMNGMDFVVRIHSLPAAAPASEQVAQGEVESGDPAYLNRLVLAEGAWPRADDECVLCAGRVMDTAYGVGDTVELSMKSGNASSVLEERTYTVVGLVKSPYYASQASLGTSSLGSGIVQQYAFVPESDFKRMVPYTEAFLTVAGAASTRYGSDEYDRIVDEAKAGIERIAGERARLRTENVRRISSLRFADEATTYDGMLDLLEFRLRNPQSALDERGECEWLVMDRSKNVGAASYSADADRVDHIASVFPFMFFLVAALVALTTMTRMVDEERMTLGTYKALGYSRAGISAKYLLYALLASGVGSVIGIVSLGQLLPAVVMYAYAIMYQVPAAGYPLDAGLALLSGGLSVGIALVATWFSTAATLSEKPASLLMPPAPKAGKRILLERIGPVWRRFSFSWKVTLRNIFRYKKRFVMTLIGIAGCTALLVTGLGLRDAINDIIDIQYTEIIHYNAAITVDDDLEPGEEESLGRVFSDGSIVYSTTRASAETMLASGPHASDKRAELVVPEDPAMFSTMLTRRTREGREALDLCDGEAIVNEKVAVDLGLGVGDAIRIARQDAMGNATSDVYELVIGGLTEMYVYNYVFVNAATYEQATGAAPTFSTYYATVTDDPAGRDELKSRLDGIGGVKTIAYNDETIDTYRTALRSVDLIVVVLVAAAAALAFIVLYNLTNINIEERVREIATLKVLGFTRRETYAYIFREVLLLSAIGCVVGLVAGVPLQNFVVVSAEVDQVMFGRTIHAVSFVGAFVLTIAFSAVSVLLMVPKLRRIDMVESLKSNE